MQITNTKTVNFDHHPVFGRNDVHVVPWGYGEWAVKREHFDEYNFEGLTKAEAIEKAMHCAKLGGVSLIIHGTNGRFQSVISFPMPANDCVEGARLIQ